MSKRNESKPSLLPKLPKYMEWRWPIDVFRGADPEYFIGRVMPLTINGMPSYAYKIIEVERLTESEPDILIRIKAERIDAPKEKSAVEDKGTD